MAGRKIFVSYKYADANVQALPLTAGLYVTTTARHYVDLLQALLDVDDHINKGENDGESLANFKDDTIATKLRDRIYDSTVTIVLMSPNMKNPYVPEQDQWIPWEISWSLRELTRDDRTSKTNAVLAVVLPDASGSYDYAVRHNTCATCNATTWQTSTFFSIISKNMFNRKQPKHTGCNDHFFNPPHQGNDHSFIYTVKWSDFVQNIGGHIDVACAIKNDANSYNLVKMP